jgi:hypothetical protein
MNLTQEEAEALAMGLVPWFQGDPPAAVEALAEVPTSSLSYLKFATVQLRGFLSQEINRRDAPTGEPARDTQRE